jgi:hypothetical protein
MQARRAIMPIMDPERQRVEKALARVNTAAYWLDEAFEIPIVRVRVGLDPLLGLLPGAGDWVGAAASLAIFLTGVRLHLPVRLLARMAWNIVFDLAIGVVPLLGDLADVGVKANRKNVDLLVAHCGGVIEGDRIRFVRDPLARERSTALGRWTATVVVVGVVAGLLTAPIFLLAWLLRALGL